MKACINRCLVLLICLSMSARCFSQVSVLMQHNNLSRTGWNEQETVLNASNVNPVSFGKLYEHPVDGHVYAQPLFVPNVNVLSKGVHNLLIIATMHNSVYAFDADDASQAAQPIWKTTLGSSVPLPDARIGYACGTYNDIKIEIGILSTPAIDTITHSIYVVFKSPSGSELTDNLVVLDLQSGSILQNGKQVIMAEVSGTGDGSQNGKVTFRSDTENQRSSLLLYGGLIYMAFAGYCDTPPYHGWLLGYKASNIHEQQIVFNASPNGAAAGIWMAGQGPAVDAQGNIYLITGNGSFDPSNNNYGNCFLKLKPLNGTMQVIDYFAPSNMDFLNEQDLDLGSDGPVLLPGTNYVTASGKEGVLYLLDRNNLGKFNAVGDTIVQRLPAFGGHLHGSSVFYGGTTGQGSTYWWSENDFLQSFTLNNGLLERSLAKGPHAPNGMPGGMLSISSDGNTAGSGVLWANIPISRNANQATVDGMLRAFDPTDISKELWNSQQIVARDGLGKFAKFCAPTVVNGKVYMATFSNKVMVYGLNPVATAYREPENPSGTKPGIEYAYYEGTWDQLPDFKSLLSKGKGIIPAIALDPATQPDNFGFTYTGYIDIPSTDVYTFYLNSDDGSKFYIGDIELIDNDGLHGALEMTGGIGLKAGKHSFTVSFFEKGGDAVLSLNISSPNMPKQPVASAMLSYLPLVSSRLILTPNPVWQTLTLRSGPDVASGSQYTIYNMSGQLVSSGKTSGATTTIAVQMLAAGSYTLLVIEKSKKRTFRFIKMH